MIPLAKICLKKFQYVKIYWVEEIAWNGKILGKISAQPHLKLCIQFLDRENNDINDTLKLGKHFFCNSMGLCGNFYQMLLNSRQCQLRKLHWCVEYSVASLIMRRHEMNMSASSSVWIAVKPAFSQFNSFIIQVHYPCKWELFFELNRLNKETSCEIEKVRE